MRSIRTKPVVRPSIPDSPSGLVSIVDQIDKTRVPAHIAIIMDGNGRWARRRKMPRLWGHRSGTKSVRDVVEAAGQIGVKVLTLYAFSTENWSRPSLEVRGLMRLLSQTIKGEIRNLDRNNVRLETIGDLSRLPEEVRRELADSRAKLSKNTGLTLVLALNYGGRQEIVHAFNAMAEKGLTRITEEDVAAHLQTSRWPDPDLLIRTSGEFRVSNFLLWQIAYAELHITPVLWPDFRREHLYRAILDFQTRERRFGAL